MNLALALAVAMSVAAQSTDPSPAVLEKDALFWKAYNACDVPGMLEHFTEDLEFYHDKGGAILGLAALRERTRTGLCGNAASRLRREAVEGTVRVFPLANAGVVYGAILSGEHVFYVTEKGRPEFLDGRARFTHLWLKTDAGWKMARVLSYDHGPAVR
ncbi:MAG TPA: nuclear transport factor 2 family protein [Vicinamibacteria bacterium]|nr:nuclear transport factor 2 family protein [Vicinamibacteria bacterium]